MISHLVYKDLQYLDAVHTVSYFVKDDAVQNVKGLESYQEKGAVSNVVKKLMQ